MDHLSNRREFLAATGALTTAGLLAMFDDLGPAAQAWAAAPAAAPAAPAVPTPGELVLPKLPYPEDGLEPIIDAATVALHHDRHHAGYVAGFNKTLAALAAAREAGDFAAIAPLERQLAFHGGGHVNHAIYWETMAPPGRGGGGEPVGPLAEQIATDFGSFAKFKLQFSAAATAVEGSGWAWLIWHPLLKQLLITTLTQQQDEHLPNSVPLLGLDVWEHAYYLRYQNKRASYVTNWWLIVNWGRVGELFAAARK